MRILELLVVLLTGLSLLPFSYKKKAIWLALSFILMDVAQHLIEGSRWQLVPIYVAQLFIILGTVIGQKRILRTITLGIGALFLLVGSFLAFYALPVQKGPRPSGAHQVGVVHHYTADRSRRDIYADGDIRQLAYFTFYPTEVSGGKKRKYVPEFEKWLPSIQKKLDWPTLILDYIKYWQASSIVDAAPTEAKYPLIIYSHGLTNNYLESTRRLEELASHGYVVVAINHPYGADLAYDADGQLMKYKRTEQLGDDISLIDRNRSQRAAQWVEDVDFIIGEVGRNRKDVDLSKVATMGFSHGGTTASLALQKLENVRAAINLDGTPRGIDFSIPIDKPHLLISSEREYFSDAQIAAWGITREMVDAPADLKESRMRELADFNKTANRAYWIAATKHSNMTDYPLLSPLSSTLGFGGQIDSKRCHKMINQLVIAFLDHHLKDSRAKGYPLDEYIREL